MFPSPPLSWQVMSYSTSRNPLCYPWWHFLHRAIEFILHQWLPFYKFDWGLNDFHVGAFGGHLFKLEKTQKIFHIGHFWPSIIKYCIQAINKHHPYQVYTWKVHTPPLPLHLVVFIVPFVKWGVDFMISNPPSIIGHHYILVVVDHFTKWVEAMPTMSNNGTMEALFIFNHIVARFDIPKEIVTGNGSHFQNRMMQEMTSLLGFHHKYSSRYYLQVNDQVEVVNKVIKTMLQKTIEKNRSNWHSMLFSHPLGLSNLSYDNH